MHWSTKRGTWASDMVNVRSLQPPVGLDMTRFATTRTDGPDEIDAVFDAVGLEIFNFRRLPFIKPRILRFIHNVNDIRPGHRFVDRCAIPLDSPGRIGIRCRIQS